MPPKPPTPPRLTASSAVLEIDPSTPGTAVRAALALESLFNLVLARGMLLAPRATANQLFPRDAATPALDDDNGGPVLALLVQWVGVWTLATTVPLLLALPNRAGAVERRQMAYAALAAMEALYYTLSLWPAEADGVYEYYYYYY
ncbi:Amidohydrolase [Neofusicoccum parvum]|uniref:Amidohydrolase n=1 Tax=Neofusicoccum parvum TaxID=310453 RepID=A0ACB5SMB4_9PEZI|nr:Amidohydrolase [Neofusicoccum parvum]